MSAGSERGRGRETSDRYERREFLCGVRERGRRV